MKGDCKIGIMDSKNSLNNFMLYKTSSIKEPEGVNEGTGYKAGDIVEVQVDRVCNHVKYFVNDKLQATQTGPMLADSSLVFVPVVFPENLHDKFEWLMYWIKEKSNDCSLELKYKKLLVFKQLRGF